MQLATILSSSSGVRPADSPATAMRPSAGGPGQLDRQPVPRAPTRPSPVLGVDEAPLQGELLARPGSGDLGILTYLALRGLNDPHDLRRSVFVDLYA
jgi:hypothetical protein